MGAPGKCARSEKLKDEGVITEEEYKSKQAQFLGRTWRAPWGLGPRPEQGVTGDGSSS